MKNELTRFFLGVWAIVVLGSFIATVVGAFGFLVPNQRTGDYVPTCNGQTMRPGDVCDIWSTDPNSHYVAHKSYDTMVNDHYQEQRDIHQRMTTMFMVAAPVTVLSVALPIVALTIAGRRRPKSLSISELAEEHGWTFVPSVPDTPVSDAANSEYGRLSGKHNGWSFTVEYSAKGTWYMVQLPVGGLPATKILRLKRGARGIRYRDGAEFGKQLMTDGTREAFNRLYKQANIACFRVGDAALTANILFSTDACEIDRRVSCLVDLAAALPADVLQRYGRQDLTRTAP